ncbi:MAG TPA: hypothetical protein DDY91_04275 [Planctomycetaceae bacterium]|nr:hypothetical protein [Planctomycetaceae bacterium]
MIGALSALANQILVLILDVKAQALQSRLWKRIADGRSELPAVVTSLTTIQTSEELRMRVVQEMKDSLIDAMNRITTPVNQTANRLLDVGRGLAESQGRLQESVTRFVTATDEASLRMQEAARRFEAGQEQLRGRFEEVLQSLQEVPDELRKVTTVWNSSLQCLAEQSPSVNSHVREMLSPPSSEPHAVVPSLESSSSRLSERRTGFGDLRVQNAAAEGTSSLREVRAPQPANRAPRLTRGDLDERPRGSPSKPELTTSIDSNVPAFRLDPQRIHAIQSETEQVNEFLRAAMRDPERERADGEPIPVSPQIVRSLVPVSTVPLAEISPQIKLPESDGDATDCFRELPSDLREFLRAVLTHRAWTRFELDQLSRQHRVMLGSAIERVNEWSLTRFNDALFVEDKESFLVQVDLLQ